MSNLIWNDISGRTEGKVIVTGPSHCAWAYFFLYHTPFLAKIREENPDAIIVGGGYESDWWYARGLCDYYVGHPIDNKIKTLVGRQPGTTNPMTADLVELAKEKLGRVDSIISVDGDDLQTAALYRNHFDVTIKRPPYKHDPTSNRIAIWGRHKPNSARTIYNCKPEHWDRTIDYLINKGFDVSIMGAKGGCYESQRCDVESMLDLPEQTRAQQTFEHLEGCLCSLSDLNASAYVCMYLGHPVCIFNAQYREIGAIPVRNVFNTLTTCGNPWDWPDWRGPNPAHAAEYDDYKDVWETAIDDMIKRARTEKVCELDEVNMGFMAKYVH